MTSKKKIIGVVAPGRALTKDDAERVSTVAEKQGMGDDLELRFHPQCFLSHGHFAGDDAARSAGFVDYANDASIDAIWFAKGGYGSCRIADDAFEQLNDSAQQKTYLGYSDAGIILARLYAKGFQHLAHGPMPTDINRDGGETAIARALTYLVKADAATIENYARKSANPIAFNIKVLSHCIAAPWFPDLSDHTLLLEDIAEYHYQLDRSLFTITSSKKIRSCAGIRLGRCADIPENDIDFGADEVEIVKYWCDRKGIAYLGRADIGHDAENKIVPFGDQENARQS